MGNARQIISFFKSAMRLLFTILLILITNVVWAEPPVNAVRVLKGAHRLQLLADGQVVRDFRIALGRNPQGHKMQAGDGRTPEGTYTLDYKKSDSAFYKAMHISYPNADDLAAAKARGVNPGSLIMLHGQKNGMGFLAYFTQWFNWTNGCIALSNEDMDTLWALVAEGTTIEILP